MNIRSNSNTAIWITVVVFIVFTLIFCWRMFAPRPQMTQLELTVVVASDSVSQANINPSHKALLDSISSIVNKQGIELNEHYRLFMKAREDDADLIKILSYFAGFVAALFTIIGLRSFKDLKDRVEENTKELAKQTASATARSHLQGDIQNEISNRLNNDYFYRDIRTRVLDYINRELIVALEERISTLENRTKASDSTPPESHQYSVNESHLTNSDNISIEIDAPLPEESDE